MPAVLVPQDTPDGAQAWVVQNASYNQEESGEVAIVSLQKVDISPALTDHTHEKHQILQKVIYFQIHFGATVDCQDNHLSELLKMHLCSCSSFIW